MTDYKTNPAEFRRRTLRRLFGEVGVLAILIVAAISGYVTVVPMWVQWTAIVIGAAFLFGGLAGYSRARTIAASFSVSLGAKALAFSHAGGSGELPYSELTISKVKRVRGKVVEIALTPKSGPMVKLSNLHNMDELYDSLVQRIANPLR